MRDINKEELSQVSGAGSWSGWYSYGKNWWDEHKEEVKEKVEEKKDEYEKKKDDDKKYDWGKWGW